MQTEKVEHLHRLAEDLLEHKTQTETDTQGEQEAPVMQVESALLTCMC